MDVDETPMAYVLPLCPLRLRIVGNTLPARTADSYEIAARRAGGFCVLEGIEQQDHSLRMRESAGADRMVERSVRRVTTALRSVVTRRSTKNKLTHNVNG